MIVSTDVDSAINEKIILFIALPTFKGRIWLNQVAPTIGSNV